MFAVRKESEHVEAVIDGDIDHSSARIRRAVELHLIDAPARETAAVYEQDDGRVMRIRGLMYVKDQTVLVIGE